MGLDVRSVFKVLHSFLTHILPLIGVPTPTWANALAIRESNPKMIQVHTAPETKMVSVTTAPRSRRPIRRIVLITVCILGCAVIAGGVLVHHFWPFTESSVRSRLAESASASVRFGGFHEKYFPPGCVVESVIFQRNNSGPALISIQRLTVRSNLVGLLRGRISLLRAEGMHVILAHSDFSGTKSSGNQTTVGELIADDAVLEVRRNGGGQPLRFVFHKFQMDNLGGGGTTKFAAVFDNPLPAGQLQTSGQFGPWNSSDPAATTVSGKYSLANADLGVFKSIGGALSSKEPSNRWKLKGRPRRPNSR